MRRGTCLDTGTRTIISGSSESDPGALLKVLTRRAACWLSSAITGLTLALVFTTGCAAGRVSPTPSAPSSQVLIDAALAGDAVACAEEQFRAAGYATHRDARNPLVVQADRETSTVGTGYEVNVARAYLRPVDGNPKLLQWWVSAETRAFSSRGYNSGYEIRTPARGEVLLLTRRVTEICAKA